MQDCSWGVCVAHPCELGNLLLSALSRTTRGTPAIRGTPARQWHWEVASFTPEKADKTCHKVLYLCLNLIYKALPAGKEVGMAATATALLWREAAPLSLECEQGREAHRPAGSVVTWGSDPMVRGTMRGRRAPGSQPALQGLHLSYVHERLMIQVCLEQHVV